ncbi:MAG TPA: hypothetical protein VFF76_04390 [Holophagaceae bacterium]|nr:hypothetical protein [Holophagaceae bacterium]
MALLASLGLGHVLGALNLPLSRGEWVMVYGMGVVGALDDRLNLRARWKALLALGSAAVLAWLTWDVLRQAGSSLPLFNSHLATQTSLALLLLWAWYWAIPQSCNLIDGMNGLALGFFLLLALFMGLPMGLSGEGAYFLGTLVALAVLNWPFGKQFLGDSGSLTLGTVFALLGVHLLAIESPNRLLWTFAYPIVDVLMVMAIRLSNGRPLGEGDRNHFHHHWQRALGNQSSAALAMTLLPAFACMQVLQDYPGHRFAAWAGLVWLGASAFWFYFRSVRHHHPSELPSRQMLKARPLEEGLAGATPSGGTLAWFRQDQD